MLAQRVMWIAWPAFLVAGVLEMLVFAVLDPLDIPWLTEGFDISRAGLYTVAFFVFWMVTAVASAMSIFLAYPAQRSSSMKASHAD